MADDISQVPPQDDIYELVDRLQENPEFQQRMNVLHDEMVKALANRSTDDWRALFKNDFTKKEEL